MADGDTGSRLEFRLFGQRQGIVRLGGEKFVGAVDGLLLIINGGQGASLYGINIRSVVVIVVVGTLVVVHVRRPFLAGFREGMLVAQHHAMVVEQRVGGRELARIGISPGPVAVQSIDINGALRIWSKGAVHNIAADRQCIPVIHEVIQSTAGEGEVTFIDCIVRFLQTVIGWRRVRRRSGLVERITVNRSLRDGFTLVEVAAEEEIDLPLFDIDIAACVGSAAVIHTCAKVAIIAGFPVLLQHDVEDPGLSAAGIVFGAGVGDDLDALDGIAGDLVEGECCWPSVHKNSGRAVAEGDITVDIYLQRRHVPHDIDAAAAGSGNIFVDIIYFPVDAHGQQRFGCRHSGCLHRLAGSLGKLDITQILIEGIHGCQGLGHLLLLSIRIVRTGSSRRRAAPQSFQIESYFLVIAVIADRTDPEMKISEDGQVLEAEFAATPGDQAGNNSILRGMCDRIVFGLDQLYRNAVHSLIRLRIHHFSVEMAYGRDWSPRTSSSSGCARDLGRTG